MGRLDIAKYTLQVAEAQGVHDWKTLSALGTLHAKAGEHSEAQRYFLAALKAQPDAISVTNNLALSYALDGKADKAEQLLRNAVASGPDDKRVRQNLALVLGVQGKFDEARKIASSDLPEADAKSNMAYLKSMLSAPTSVASLGPDDGVRRTGLWNGNLMPRMSLRADAKVRTAMAGPAADPGADRRDAAADALGSRGKGRQNRLGATPAVHQVAPQGSGSTTIAKSQPVAEAAPPADAATKADKLASAPTPTRTANLLKADIE